MLVWMEHSKSIFTIFNWAKRLNHPFKSLLSAPSVCPLSAAVLVWIVRTHSQTYNPSHHPSSATLCKSTVFGFHSYLLSLSTPVPHLTFSHSFCIPFLFCTITSWPLSSFLPHLFLHNQPAIVRLSLCLCHPQAHTHTPTHTHLCSNESLDDRYIYLIHQ